MWIKLNENRLYRSLCIVDGLLYWNERNEIEKEWDKKGSETNGEKKKYGRIASHQRLEKSELSKYSFNDISIFIIFVRCNKSVGLLWMGKYRQIHSSIDF